MLMVQGSGLYERLHETCKQEGSAGAGRAMTMAHLKLQDRDSLHRPSFLVLCSPPGLPVDQIMQQLAAQHADNIGRVVSHTSRTPMVSAWRKLQLSYSC